MSVWIALEKGLSNNNNLKATAAFKAREDIEKILLDQGIKKLVIEAPQQERIQAKKVKKAVYHYIVKKCWGKAFEKLKEGDTIWIQFPIINQTIFFDSVIKKAIHKKIQVIAIVHDLELLRFTRNKEINKIGRWRMKKEEISTIKLFTKVVLHNNKMADYVRTSLGVEEQKIEIIEIFDYLIDKNTKLNNTTDDTQTQNYNCIIAGNLSENKAQYVYHLPTSCYFELYGPYYTGKETERCKYNGVFSPDQLPTVLNGKFGIVWDGDSIETCSGSWGEYLRYNNPHKTSLYLACGIPVIIWKEAALSSFILENKVGIAVESLNDLPNVLKNISVEEYKKMKLNAENISEKLKNGYFTKQVIEKCMNE